MDKLNNEIMKLISELSRIVPICKKFKEDPILENGEEIIDVIEQSEKNLLKVKENIVRIVNDVKEKDIEVKGIVSDNGFLINKE